MLAFIFALAALCILLIVYIYTQDPGIKDKE